MMDPERQPGPPPLFREPLSLSAPQGPTARDSAAPEVNSPGRAFLPSLGKWYVPPPPAPDTLITGTAKHLSMVVDLQKKFSNQLGFLPKKALEWYVENKLTGIALENGEPCGYVLGRGSYRYQRLMRPITQAAVCMDAHRRHHGLALVEAVCRRAVADGQQAVQASCAIDIEACEFWSAAGFIPIHTHKTDNARGREIVVFRRCLTSRVPTWFRDPPPVAGYRARRAK